MTPPPSSTVGVFNYKDIYCEMKELIRHILHEHTREIGEVKKTTTPEFIEKAKVVHGDKYDYSKVDYQTAKTKVIITCKKHGDFLQTPDKHLGGTNCPKCSLEEKGNNRRTNIDDFIERAKAVHGDLYDYSKVRYKNNKTPVTIICPIHGEFEQFPQNHLRGAGCAKCTKGLLSNDDFIKKAQEIHGNNYDYSEVNYKNNKTPVTIICPIHGKFNQYPNNHIVGYGCPTCGKEKMIKTKTKNVDDFIEEIKKIHGNKYDYSNVDYKGAKVPVEIICPKHGAFLQAPSNHLNGAGCPKCGVERTSLLTKHTTDEFIDVVKKIHRNKYDYSKVNYEGSRIPVEIICPKHGVFSQLPGNHLKGMGCPRCSESKGELLVNDILTNKEIDFVRQKKFLDCRLTSKIKKCRPLPFDFYIPELNTCIEYDGAQHYIPVEKWGGEEKFKKQKIVDKFKNQYCKKNGIKLIRIPYTMKKEEIEPYILKELGIK